MSRALAQKHFSCPGCGAEAQWLGNPKGIVSSSPGLRGTSYPGSLRVEFFNLNGVASPLHASATTPLGLSAFDKTSQGSSFLATLGFAPESLWDSASVPPHSFCKPAAD
jgi:hypothetical protein